MSGFFFGGGGRGTGNKATLKSEKKSYNYGRAPAAASFLSR